MFTYMFYVIPPKTPIFISREENYDVESIVTHGYNTKGAAFTVKWLDYGEEDNSQLSYYALHEHCKELCVDYMLNVNDPKLSSSMDTMDLDIGIAQNGKCKICGKPYENSKGYWKHYQTRHKNEDNHEEEDEKTNSNIKIKSEGEHYLSNNNQLDHLDEIYSLSIFTNQQK